MRRFLFWDRIQCVLTEYAKDSGTYCAGLGNILTRVIEPLHCTSPMNWSSQDESKGQLS